MEERPLARRRSSGPLVPDGPRGSATGSKVVGAMEQSDHGYAADRQDMEMEDMVSDEEAIDDEDNEGTGLTNAETRKQRRHKGRTGSLISSETTTGGPGSAGNKIVDIQKEEEKLASAAILRNTLINALLIALWYSFSISISVYNKWMFSKENLNFPFPLFTTSVHMLVQFSLACSVLFFLPRFRPSNAPEVDKPQYTQLSNIADEAEAQPQAISQLRSETAPEPASEEQKRAPLMTKTFFFTRIAPCGTATALDIGLGNFSLRFISLSFFTMCKSSVLLFVLLFAFLFHLESPTWKLCAIISIMTVGVVMMVAGEAAFNAAGFALVMSASACSGLRWSLTQILLLRNRATSNPFSATFFLTPVMFLALFLLAVPIEGPANVVRGVDDLSRSEGGFVSIVILLFPGFLAFLMVSAEFALLKRTSVVTLSVCGIFKEVLTISAAGIIFGDELTPINVSGLVVTIGSIVAYNWLKYIKMKADATEEIKEILEEQQQEGGEGRKSVDRGRAESEAGRGSADELMRGSLQTLTNLNDGQESKPREVPLSSGKRPEDLE